MLILGLNCLFAKHPSISWGQVLSKPRMAAHFCARLPNLSSLSQFVTISAAGPRKRVFHSLRRELLPLTYRSPASARRSIAQCKAQWPRSCAPRHCQRLPPSRLLRAPVAAGQVRNCLGGDSRALKATGKEARRTEFQLQCSPSLSNHKRRGVKHNRIYGNCIARQ